MPEFRSYQRPEPDELGATKVAPGFRFSSDNNSDWLDEKRLTAMFEETAK
jgi:hypothetical protein